MKKLKIPGIVNLYKLDEPEEIQALARDPLFSYVLDLRFVYNEINHKGPACG